MNLRLRVTGLLLAVIGCVIALPGAAFAATTHTVPVKRMCQSFGTKYLTCSGGYANQAGTLTKYQIVGRTPDGVATTKLMAASKTSCKTMSMQFWGGTHDGRSTIRVLTTTGTYRATAKANHLATIHVVLNRGPFKVWLTQTGDGSGGVGHAYIVGSASCTSKTGER